MPTKRTRTAAPKAMAPPSPTSSRCAPSEGELANLLDTIKGLSTILPIREMWDRLLFTGRYGWVWAEVSRRRDLGVEDTER